MNNETTIKALEELAKSEYTTATALDEALADAEDTKLRAKYRKWRDSHTEQAELLNGRIKELGGHTTRYQYNNGGIYRILWRLIKGSPDHRSLVGVRLAASRGIKQYMNHLDQINDRKTLTVLRQNLEAKQDEMRWYDDQVIQEHNQEFQAELEKMLETAKSLEKDAGTEKKEHRRGTPLATLAVASAIGVGAAAYFMVHRNEVNEVDGIEDDFTGISGNGTSDSTAHGEFEIAP